MAIIIDTICSSKISFQNTLHENTYSERNEMSIRHEKLNNIVVDSNVATSISVLSVSSDIRIRLYQCNLTILILVKSMKIIKD